MEAKKESDAYGGTILTGYLIGPYKTMLPLLSPKTRGPRFAAFILRQLHYRKNNLIHLRQVQNEYDVLPQFMLVTFAAIVKYVIATIA